MSNSKHKEWKEKLKQSKTGQAVQNNNSSNVGFFGWVFLLFLGLKLAEVGKVASWSWIWVTAPLWGPIAFVVVLFVLGFLWVLTLQMVSSDNQEDPDNKE